MPALLPAQGEQAGLVTRNYWIKKKVQEFFKA